MMLNWTLFTVFVAICSDLTFTRKYGVRHTVKYWTLAILLLGGINAVLVFLSAMVPEYLSYLPYSQISSPETADAIAELHSFYQPICDMFADILMLLSGTAVTLYAVWRLYTESGSAKTFIVSFYCILTVILCGFVCNTIRMIFFEKAVFSSLVLTYIDISIQLVLLTLALFLVMRYLIPHIKMLKRDLHENFSGFLMVPVIAYGTYILNFSIWNAFDEGLTAYKISTSLLLIVLYILIYWLILHGITTISRQYQTEQDLLAARKLQAAALPSAGSLSAIPGVEIAAAMTPAREVGGDFYDVIRLDDSRVALVIADVSGKGIPAALFMMQAKTVLREYLSQIPSPGAALTTVSRRLLENNDTCMFVTVFCGVLSPADGTFTYSCAGHNPPVLRSREGVSPLVFPKEPFLGIKEHMYRDSSMQLRSGDMLLFYTDGVSEAENCTGEFYGLSRLVSVLTTVAGPQDAVSAVVADVLRFSDGAVQSDDITLLAVRYAGVAGTLHVPACVERLPEVLAYVSAALRDEGLPDTVLRHAELICEEIFINIALYAYPDSCGSADVTVCPGGMLIFADSGVAFNPLDAPAPDLSLPLAERRVGGYGIYFAKKWAKSLRYTYTEGRNILRVEL